MEPRNVMSNTRRTTRHSAWLKSTLFGVGSLGNLGGDYVSFHGYMGGSDLEDMRNDWRKVGDDIRSAMKRAGR
jgi:hypothetical protein